MAHVAKYQASACGRMCEHYDRTPMLSRGFTRSNIDPERTPRNRNLAPDRGCSGPEFIEGRIQSLELKRAPRKDAVRMCDCVLTLPKTLDSSREEEFFASAYEFLSERYGVDNVISAWVHLDETTPHMHFAWVPVTPDGRLSAKDVVSRNDLRTLHRDLQKHLESDLGCEVEVILDPEKVGEKQLSELSQSQYVEVKKTIERLVGTKQGLESDIERLERHRQEIQPAAETLSESLRTLSKARNDGKRAEGLGIEIEGLRERISASEGEIRGLERDIERKESAIGGLEREIASKKLEVADLDERIEKAECDVSRLGERLGRLRECMGTVLTKLGKAMESMTDATKELALKLGLSVEGANPQVRAVESKPAHTVANVAKAARARAAAARNEGQAQLRTPRQRAR